MVATYWASGIGHLSPIECREFLSPLKPGTHALWQFLHRQELQVLLLRYPAPAWPPRWIPESDSLHSSPKWAVLHERWHCEDPGRYFDLRGKALQVVMPGLRKPKGCSKQYRFVRSSSVSSYLLDIIPGVKNIRTGVCRYRKLSPDGLVSHRNAQLALSMFNTPEYMP